MSTDAAINENKYISILQKERVNSMQNGWGNKAYFYLVGGASTKLAEIVKF